MYMYLCMCTCIYTCMYICMYICIYVCIYVCVMSTQEGLKVATALRYSLLPSNKTTLWQDIGAFFKTNKPYIVLKQQETHTHLVGRCMYV